MRLDIGMLEAVLYAVYFVFVDASIFKVMEPEEPRTNGHRQSIQYARLSRTVYASEEGESWMQIQLKLLEPFEIFETNLAQSQRILPRSTQVLMVRPLEQLGTSQPRFVVVLPSSPWREVVAVSPKVSVSSAVEGSFGG